MSERETERSVVKTRGDATATTPVQYRLETEEADTSHTILTTPAERRRGMQILFIGQICVGMGQSSIFTILPSIARKIDMPEYMVSSIFTISALIWVLTSQFWGRKSDYWGRKPVILLGMGGYLVSTTLFGVAVSVALAGLLPLASAYFFMVLTRSIFGLFGSGTMPAMQAYVADRTSARERASGLGTIGAAFGVGTIIGPVFVGMLSYFGLVAPIFFVAFLAFLSWLFLWRMLPERTRPQIRQGRTHLRLLDPRTLPFILFGAVLSLVQAITIQTISFFFMDKLSLPPEQAPQFVGVGLMVSAMASLFVLFVLIPRFGLTSRFLMRWGVGLGLVSYVLLVLVPNFTGVIFALMINGAAFGMMRPGFSAAASLSVDPDEQGAVAGLLGSTAPVGHLLTPFIIAFIYQVHGYNPTYLINVGLMAVLLLMVFIHPALKHSREDYIHKEDELDDRADSGIPKG